jgi:hypothetical protein
MTSDKQIAANRRNALKSTGPRTSAGKARVGRNAVKHGILARTILDAAHDSASFASLLADLRQAFDPQDALDDQLVESVAVAYWRQQRVLRAEVLAVRSDVDSFADILVAKHNDMLHDCTSTLDQTTGSDIPWLYWPAFTSRSFRRLHTFSRGCAWLITQIDDLRARIAGDPENIRPHAERFASLFANDESLLGQYTRHFIRFLVHDHLPPPLHPHQLADVLTAFDARRAELDRLRIKLEQAEAAEIEHHRAATTLPESTQLDKFLRYEKTITNQLYRALAALESRRRARSAFPISPDPQPAPVPTQ